MIAAAQATKLCLDMQSIARSAGHVFPLLIAIDQENGGLNSLSDTSLIHEFPSNLGLAAASSRSLTRQVAKATAQELKAVGVNFVLGPVLDIITDTHSQVLGPRSFGESPENVSALGQQYINGCRDAGLASCGKHFPSFEKLDFLRASSASLHDLSRTSLAPFRDAISHGVDAIMVGDVAVNSLDVNEMHACLSERIVNGLLRKDMRFGGVVVSECLELSLSRDIGIQGATVMGIRAGCDLVMVCRSLPLQKEALQGLELGLEGGTLEASKVQASVSRIIKLKTRCTSWEAALSPAGTHGLHLLRKSHKDLSSTAYNRSITVVRDSKGQLPLTNAVVRDRPILLLTPLITPLPSSKYHSQEDTAPEMRSSELIFQRFGAVLGKHASTKVIHTSYSAHGVRSRHEDLISQAAAIVIITADANRNKYQNAFAKHVTLLCNQKLGSVGRVPCAVVAVTSPYDFASDNSVDPYICTYDYTETALRSLVLVLCGETQAQGTLSKAVAQPKAKPSRQQWLVEKFNYERDSTSLTNLLNAVRSDTDSVSLGLDQISTDGFLFSHEKIDSDYQFVVRNSSTKELFGYCASYYVEDSATGYLGFLVVDPKRRKKSIGDSLHSRALLALQQIPGIAVIQLGFSIPTTLPGIPGSGSNREELHEWFSRRDWHIDGSVKRSRITISELQGWKTPEGLSRSLNLPNVKYEILQGGQEIGAVFEHVRSFSSPEIEMLYKVAPTGKVGSGVIRAKSLNDGEIIGT